MAIGNGQATVAMGPRPAQEVLAWGRDVLDPALRAAVGTLPDAVRLVAEFHFGWCDESGRPVGGEAAPAIHPTLALLTADAAGGAHDVALPAAVAVQLIQGFTRMHDDAIDAERPAGHAPTAYSVFGIGPAILVGSALQALAFDTLAAAAGDRARDALRILGATVHELVEARMTELALRLRTDVGAEECLRAAGARTGALLGCACALGELLATGDERRMGLMRTFGERLGLAILYGRGDGLPVQDVRSASALVEASGGPAWPQDESSRQLAVALDALRLARASDSGRATGELETLATLARAQ